MDYKVFKKDARRLIDKCKDQKSTILFEMGNNTEEEFIKLLDVVKKYDLVEPCNWVSIGFRWNSKDVDVDFYYCLEEIFVKFYARDVKFTLYEMKDTHQLYIKFGLYTTMFIQLSAEGMLLYRTMSRVTDRDKIEIVSEIISNTTLYHIGNIFAKSKRKEKPKL